MFTSFYSLFAFIMSFFFLPRNRCLLRLLPPTCRNSTVAVRELVGAFGGRLLFAALVAAAGISPIHQFTLFKLYVNANKNKAASYQDSGFFTWGDSGFGSCFSSSFIALRRNSATSLTLFLVRNISYPHLRLYSVPLVAVWRFHSFMW